jgi:hypothetical protein
MDRMSTMVLMLEHQEQQKAPYLMCQMSKWFYGTSTGTATRAARCGSLLEELRCLELAAMDEARWTRVFTWFEPPEHNTLHPRRGLLYCSVFFKLALSWPELDLSVNGVELHADPGPDR